nr:uncharacterized protein LOC127323375 [Lolium perenne]
MAPTSTRATGSPANHIAPPFQGRRPGIPTLPAAAPRETRNTAARFDLQTPKKAREAAAGHHGRRVPDPGQAGLARPGTPCPNPHAGGRGGHPAHASPCSIPEGLATAGPARPWPPSSRRRARRPIPPPAELAPPGAATPPPEPPPPECAQHTSHHAAAGAAAPPRPCQRRAPSRRDRPRRRHREEGEVPRRRRRPELRPAAPSWRRRSGGGGEKLWRRRRFRVSPWDSREPRDETFSL